jgi:DNA-binding response OmpR family regulator
LRRAAEARLRRHGLEVLTAADGEEALRIARAEPLDLVLLDVVMPKLEGFEVLKALKDEEATARIPVIVLSNLGQERDVARAKALGAVAFFVKAHLSLQDLVDRVDAVLATGQA